MRAVYLLVLVLGCDGGKSNLDGGGMVGEENGPCYGNGTCNAGLECVSGTCRKRTADGGPCILGQSQVGNCTLTK